MGRSKTLIWAVVLLAILNAATISTILFHNYREKQATEKIGINTGTEVTMLNGRFFRQTLGFNETQMDSFRVINQSFRPYAMNATYQVDTLKTAMFTELQSTAPDTVRLNALSKQIGELHGVLKIETYHFYLNLKNICYPAQVAELEKAFLPLFKNENITTPNQQQRRRWNLN